MSVPQELRVTQDACLYVCEGWGPLWAAAILTPFTLVGAQLVIAPPFRFLVL